MYDLYTLNKNENIDLVSKKINVDKNIIKSINNINSEIISGNTILIPMKKSDCFDYYKIVEGDTIYNIANKYNINVNVLATINGIDNTDYIYSNQIIKLPKKNIGIYITSLKDTIMSVVNKTNVSIENILSENINLFLLPEQLIVYKKN